MGTKDQLLYSALHGTAMWYIAEQRSLAESIAELRQIADGHDEVLAEAAGITAGSWYAWPSTHVGHELVAAGMPSWPAAMTASPWTMRRWSAGRALASSGEQGSARASGECSLRASV